MTPSWIATRTLSDGSNQLDVMIDGSLYPRSPGIAPSMTIAALAERQASLMA